MRHEGILSRRLGADHAQRRRAPPKVNYLTALGRTAEADGGKEAKRAFAATMPMGKIDVALIDAARRGDR